VAQSVVWGKLANPGFSLSLYVFTVEVVEVFGYFSCFLYCVGTVGVGVSFHIKMFYITSSPNNMIAKTFLSLLSPSHSLSKLLPSYYLDLNRAILPNS
jgi:hypothetical protein